MYRMLIPAAALASFASASSADSIRMRFEAGLGTRSIYRIWTGGGNNSWTTFSGGALRHDLVDGDGFLDSPLYEGENRCTFCTDLEAANGGFNRYLAVDPTLAPIDPDGNPGENQRYSGDEKRRLNAWAYACRDLGLINNQGFFVLGGPRSVGGSAQLYSQEDIGMAVQFGVWDSLWDNGTNAPWDHTLGQGENRLNNEVYLSGSYSGLSRVRAIVDIVALQAMSYYSDANFQGNLVRILAHRSEQDQMILIPLPPAAWVGISSLAGIGVFGYVRRRSFRA